MLELTRVWAGENHARAGGCVTRVSVWAVCVSLRESETRECAHSHTHDLAIQCFTVWIGRAPYVKYICRARPQVERIPVIIAEFLPVSLAHTPHCH